MLSDWHPIARLLIIGGVLLIVAGLIVQFGGRFLPMFGRLPGDILIERENVRVSIPIVSMLIVSVVLTIVLNVIARIQR